MKLFEHTEHVPCPIYRAVRSVSGVDELMPPASRHDARVDESTFEIASRRPSCRPGGDQTRERYERCEDTLGLIGR